MYIWQYTTVKTLRNVENVNTEQVMDINVPIVEVVNMSEIAIRTVRKTTNVLSQLFQ